jgi:hypothetical protein
MLLEQNAEIQLDAPGETTASFCTACHQSKPHSLFHLKGRDKDGLSRFQSTCKDCANKNRVARYQKKKSQKRRFSKAGKKFDPSNCAIEIIYHECEGSSQMVIDVMADYIEAVYAMQIHSTVI